MKRKAAPAQKSLKKPSKKKTKKTNVMDRYATHIPPLQLKRVDVTTTLQYFDNTTTNANNVLLNGLTNGDFDFNRISNGVKWKSLTMKVRISCVPQIAGTYPADSIRLIVVYDRAANGTLAAVSDVQKAVDSGGSASSTAITPFNFDNRDRFYVLVDQMLETPGFTVAIAGGVPTYTTQSPDTLSSEALFWKIYRKINFSLDTKYIGSSAGIGGIGQGAIFAMFRGGFSNGGSPWGCQFSSSMEYSDVK